MSDRPCISFPGIGFSACDYDTSVCQLQDNLLISEGSKNACLRVKQLQRVERYDSELYDKELALPYEAWISLHTEHVGCN
jgi:hypothetical protein